MPDDPLPLRCAWCEQPIAPGDLSTVKARKPYHKGVCADLGGAVMWPGEDPAPGDTSPAPWRPSHEIEALEDAAHDVDPHPYARAQFEDHAARAARLLDNGKLSEAAVHAQLAEAWATRMNAR